MEAKYAIVDAAFDFRVFKSRLVKIKNKKMEPNPLIRPFNKESMTIKSLNNTWLSLLDQTILLTILCLAGRQHTAKLKKNEVISIRTTLRSLINEAGLNCKTNDIKDSLRRLHNIIYSGSNDPEPASELLTCTPVAIELRERADEQEIKIHPRFSRAIDERINKPKNKSNIKYSFIIIDLNERQELMRGDYHEKAMLLHAWFSSTVHAGQTSPKYKISTLFETISVMNKEIENTSIKRQRNRLKEPLEELLDIYWGVQYIKENVITVTRPI